ncbi:hypothetical protein PENTCL1PPCAC_28630, partial [Pristionchus entomophagus]
RNMDDMEMIADFNANESMADMLECVDLEDRQMFGMEPSTSGVDNILTASPPAWAGSAKIPFSPDIDYTNETEWTFENAYDLIKRDFATKESQMKSTQHAQKPSSSSKPTVPADESDSPADTSTPDSAAIPTSTSTRTSSVDSGEDHTREEASEERMQSSVTSRKSSLTEVDKKSVLWDLVVAPSSPTRKKEVEVITLTDSSETPEDQQLSMQPHPQSVQYAKQGQSMQPVQPHSMMQPAAVAGPMDAQMPPPVLPPLRPEFISIAHAQAQAHMGAHWPLSSDPNVNQKLNRYMLIGNTNIQMSPAVFRQQKVDIVKKKRKKGEKNKTLHNSRYYVPRSGGQDNEIRRKVHPSLARGTMPNQQPQQLHHVQYLHPPHRMVPPSTMRPRTPIPYDQAEIQLQELRKEFPGMIPAQRRFDDQSTGILQPSMRGPLPPTELQLQDQRLRLEQQQQPGPPGVLHHHPTMQQQPMSLQPPPQGIVQQHDVQRHPAVQQAGMSQFPPTHQQAILQQQQWHQHHAQPYQSTTQSSSQQYYHQHYPMALNDAVEGQACRVTAVPNHAFHGYQGPLYPSTQPCGIASQLAPLAGAPQQQQPYLHDFPTASSADSRAQQAAAGDAAEQPQRKSSYVSSTDNSPAEQTEQQEQELQRPGKPDDAKEWRNALGALEHAARHRSVAGNAPNYGQNGHYKREEELAQSFRIINKELEKTGEVLLPAAIVGPPWIPNYAPFAEPATQPLEGLTPQKRSSSSEEDRPRTFSVGEPEEKKKHEEEICGSGDPLTSRACFESGDEEGDVDTSEENEMDNSIERPLEEH